MRTWSLLLLAVAGCAKPADESEAVRTAWRDYDAAVRARNLDAVKAKTTTARAQELSTPEAPQLLEFAAAARPGDAAVVTCALDGAKATLDLRGTSEGRTATGRASLIREQDGWRLDKEEWSLVLKIDAPPEPPAPPPPPAPLSPAVKAIVDRTASDDPEKGAAAWTELGARYQSPAAFLREVTAALGDERPVAFAIVEESFTGGGKTIRYFTATPKAVKGREPAATVGEALRYHLWQLEDVSGKNFKGTFAQWWAPYAVRKGLPK